MTPDINPPDSDRIERSKFVLQAQLDEYRANDARDLERLKAALAIEVDRERQRVQSHYDSWRIKLNDELTSRVENFRATIGFGVSAIRWIIVINGAAAVSILTFVGHRHAQGIGIPTTGVLAWSLRCFVAGAFFGFVTAGFSYLAQRLYGRHDVSWKRYCGHFFTGAAIMSCILAGLLFLVGAWTGTEVVAR